MELTIPTAVLSNTHSDRMSDKYVHINTHDVLSWFLDLGWSVSSANAAKHSKTPQFARHLVRLRISMVRNVKRDFKFNNDLFRIASEYANKNIPG